MYEDIPPLMRVGAVWRKRVRWLAGAYGVSLNEERHLGVSLFAAHGSPERVEDFIDAMEALADEIHARRDARLAPKRKRRRMGRLGIRRPESAR
jgi:hypothetical protein